MKLDIACVECIKNQSLRVASAIGADDRLKDELYSKVSQMSHSFSFDQTPPEVASSVYAQMASIAGMHDLYEKQKLQSTKKALSFIPKLQKQIEASSDKLLVSTKIAVAGNVIDLAAEVEFSLEDELENLGDFAHNDILKLKDELKSAKTLLVLGDNVGEHIFDKLYIQTLKKLYPNLDITYMVRGVPIINDVTIKEAKEAGFDEVCTLVDSGVDTPGFSYDRANAKAKEIFDKADIVISKGMGNYECLSPSHRGNICFLLKVKCQVVANSLGQNVGDIICKMV
ncbi:MAG: ARMT1-like domain-containing protein [Sulfurimonas sp.]|nr:ARMT1-like domain-containing protein [Sulfurimonadaceae bacterium]